MALRGVDLLLGEIEKAKDSLENIDKTIAKLTGRNPNEPAPRPGLKRNSGYGADTGGEVPGGPVRPYNRGRRGFGGDEGPIKRRANDTASGRQRMQGDGPPAKRRPSGGAFSRLGPMVTSSDVGPRDDMNSGDEEEISKHTVHSSVVANPVSKLSREEVLEISSKDRESKQRNKRMFGVLMGTLQRFKQEEKTLSDKEAKRKAVEQKLEMKARQEQENIKKERRKLFLVKQKKEQKIRRLEQKVELVKIHEDWAKQTKMLGNFIRTKARPHLYYAPKTHTSASTSRLKSTKELLEKIIKDRRKQLEEEIEELMREEVEEDEKKQDSVEVVQPPDKRNVVEQDRGKQADKDRKQSESNEQGDDEVMHEEENDKGNKENELGEGKEVRDEVVSRERETKPMGVQEKAEREQKDSKGDEPKPTSRPSRSHRSTDGDRGRTEKCSSPRRSSSSHHSSEGEGTAMLHKTGSSEKENWDGNGAVECRDKADHKECATEQVNGMGKDGGEGVRSEPVSEEEMDVNNAEEEDSTSDDTPKQ